MLGGDKARADDLSAMALLASSKLLKPGATVRSGLGEFMEAESQREGRRQKIQDAAGMLAVKDKLAGRQSTRDINKLLGVKGAELQLALKYGDPSNMSWQNRKVYFADKLKTGSMKNTEVIRASIMAEKSEDGKRVLSTTENITLNPDKFAVGLYIYDGGEQGKTVIEIIEENGIHKAIPRDEFVI